MNTDRHPGGHIDALETVADRFCQGEGFLNGVRSLVVGLSGGADSVALAHYLKFGRGLSVTACHVNHLLRGEESFRDENFVRELCAEWEVPLAVRQVDVADLARRDGISLEEAGRIVRYHCMEEVMAEAGAECIATAHTASDNLETALLNLVRGTAGLAGIPPWRRLPGKLGNQGVMVIRPLLDCSREQIEDYCSRNGLSYVTDSTNLEEAFTRNKLRHRVIPVLTEINSGAVRSVSRALAVSRQENRLLDRLALALLEKCRVGSGGFTGGSGRKSFSLDLRPLADVERPLRRRMLALFLKEHGISLSFDLLEEATERIQRVIPEVVPDFPDFVLDSLKGESVPVGTTSWARMVPGGGRVILIGSRARFTLELPFEGDSAGFGNFVGEVPYFEVRWDLSAGNGWEAGLPDGSLLRAAVCVWTGFENALAWAEKMGSQTIGKEKVYRNLLYLVLDYDRIKGSMLVRQRLPGDRIALAGGNGTKKLKKLLNEKKLTAREKSLVPVLSDDEGMVGFIGLGADCRCQPGVYTKRVLVVRYEPPIGCEIGI